MTGTMTNRSWRGFLLLVVLTTTGLLVSRAHTRAQGTAQQIIDDAAAALGGRDRVMAVKSMLLEGAGNFVGITSLRYDDDIGFRSAIEQLRDWRRAYDLTNGRARFELTRMVEYAFYIGDAPTRVPASSADLGARRARTQCEGVEQPDPGHGTHG